MPPKKRRGSGWTSRPARFTKSPPAENSGTTPAPAGTAPAEDECAAKPALFLRLMQYAPLLWATCYVPFFEAETAAASQHATDMPQTTYRKKLKGEAAKKYDKKQARNVGRSLGVLQRVANCLLSYVDVFSRLEVAQLVQPAGTASRLD